MFNSLPRRFLVVVVLVFCGTAAAFAEEPAGKQPASAPADTRPHVAVIPFEMDTAAPERDAWMATAVQETLAWRVRRAPGVIVIPTARLHQGRRELEEGATEQIEWPRVASLLGADRILTGRCSGSPQALVIQLRLLETGAERKLCAETTLEAARTFDALDAATRWALEQLGVAPVPGRVEHVIFSPPARSPSAVEYYMRALMAARAGDVERGEYYLRQSLGYDSYYRPALSMSAQFELLRGAGGLLSAETRLRAVGDLAEVCGDALDQASSELGQGTVLQLRGAFDAAYTRFETSLAMAYEHDWPYAQLSAANSLCDLYLTRRPPDGVAEEALKCFEQQTLTHAAQWEEVCLDLMQRLGDVLGEAPGANKLALIYERLDDSEHAMQAHQRTLAAAERVRSRRHQATAWLYIGQWYQRNERWDDALSATTRCLELAPSAMEPTVRLALAGIYEQRGEPAKALEQMESACKQINAGEDLPSQLVCARRIAELRMQLGQRDAAAASLQEAIDIAHALGLAEETALREKLAEWKGKSP